jgi:GTP-binding protein
VSAQRRPPRSRRVRGQEAPEEPTTRTLLGAVAVVGYPNVGKSTLINRLTQTRETVVHAAPGVTRDRKELLVEWGGETFRIVDTGGVDAGDPSEMQRQIAEQARAAIGEADVIAFVIDARAGIGAGDEELADLLRRSRKPVIVVANKLDDARHDVNALELHALGLGEPLPVSGLHGTGTGDLLDAIVERLHGVEGAAREERVSDEIGVAILGRPNVGKSSLLNALLGAPRTIVHEEPGTTRDAIDIVLERDEGPPLRLIDTAGLRRKRRHRQDVEFWSEVRSLEAASRADIALVLVDAHEGIVDQDLHVADHARKASCATLVVLSKWDIGQLDIEQARLRLHDKLRQRPPLIATSALTGRGLERLLGAIDSLYERYTSRVGTGPLNRILAEAVERRQPPLVGSRRLKVLYGAQVQTRPPRFRLTVNDRGLVTRDYAYYLENQLRDRLGLQGSPVIMDLVSR